MIRSSLHAALYVAVLALACAAAQAAPPLPRFDLTKQAQARQWVPLHDVSALTATPQGMRIDISGEDPYIAGPVADYPAGLPLWIHVRLKSDQAGNAQVFYYTDKVGTSEPNSVHLSVPAARQWVDVRMPLPPLGKGYRMRFDPPGTSGSCVLAAMWFTPRILLTEPTWPAPAPVALGKAPLTIRSGDLSLAQSRTRFDAFTVTVAGRRMAAAHGAPIAGYLIGGKLRWTRLATRVTGVKRSGAAIVATATSRDADGATWTVMRRFQPGMRPGAVDVRTTVHTSAPRRVVFLPMLTVMPGLGDATFRRNQGVFAGLEYLDAPDRSSSEDDIIGPGALRRVPDTEKITFPLMAIQGADRWVGLIWREAPNLCALFDSPDRVFHSDAHVMGLLFPGSDGQNRPDGAMLPYEGADITAKQPATADATIIGGLGASVVPAVQQYVALRGLPQVPDTGMTRVGYATWAAHAWLDTAIRDGIRFRHAYWPGATNFGPTICPDPSTWMLWLAGVVRDSALADRLRRQATASLAPVPPNQFNNWHVSHVHYPVTDLVFGSVLANTNAAQGAGRAQLGGFQLDGTFPYHQAPGKPDFGRTHFSREANGMPASALAAALESATQSGDMDLLREALRLLRLMSRFDNTVPRGAQTWEVPLHTPDILASAYLVRAYTLGYEVSGDRSLLDRAIYWAWTGVPFTYLVNPTGRPVGPYATTSVLGATNWEAPNWMGMPVQWCGLVYSDALYRLVRHDPRGPWKQIADGIAASGIQQSFTAADPTMVGLLPDSFNIRPQTRNGVAINPGTVEASAIRLFGGPLIYDFRTLRTAGIFVHAPGEIAVRSDTRNTASFDVRGWPDRPYYVLISGLRMLPRVTVDGLNVPISGDNVYVPVGGRLVLRVAGHPHIELTVAPPARR